MRKFLATSLLLVLAATLTACPPAAVEKPVIKSFTSNVPSDKLPAGGGDVTLSWATTGASEVILTAAPATPAPVLGADKVTAVVTGVKVDTTFTLTAKNSAGDTVTATKKITVSPQLATAPTITKFNVKTATILEGKSITLPVGGGPVTFVSAVTAGAGSAIASLSIDNGVGAVTPLTGGNTTFTAVTGGTYTLTATSAAGTTDTDTVNITITAATPANIVSSVPASGATGVAIDNNTIAVTFDKAMNQTTTQAAFTSAGLTAPVFVWSNGDKTLTVTSASLPNAPAATGVNKVVTYNFAATATDTTGTPLAAASTAARTYSTLKAVVATLDASLTQSGTVIFTEGTGSYTTTPPCITNCPLNDYSANEFQVGDSSSTVNGNPKVNPNFAYKDFLKFNIASIPATGTVISAKVTLTQGTAVGAPYTTLGSLKLQAITSTALAPKDIALNGTPDRFLFYTAPPTSTVVLSTDAVVGPKSALVTAAVVDDLANRGPRVNQSVYRLIFPSATTPPAAALDQYPGATDNDGAEDLAVFTAPKLEIVYTQP
jgi:hypothetical protein